VEQLNRLFGEYTADLAPGIPDPGRVVKERILYRSAREKSQLPMGSFRGDSMDVDLNDFTMPLGEPQTNRQRPGTRTPGNSMEMEPRQIDQIDQIDQIGQIRQIENIESIRGLESLEGID
jgi:hypothetical protein